MKKLFCPICKKELILHKFERMFSIMGHTKDCPIHPLNISFKERNITEEEALNIANKFIKE